MHACALQGDLQLSHLLRRAVGDDQAVHPDISRGRRKPLQPEPVNRVDVAHEDDGDLRSPPNARHRLQDPGEARAGCQCPLVGALVDDTVGQRIGERNPELHEVRAARLEFVHQALRNVQRGITRRQERDEAAAALRLQSGERLVDPVPAHAAPPVPRPRAPAATSTSLSPRPDRLRMIAWSLRELGDDARQIRHGVRGLQRGDDPFGLAEQSKALQGLRVGDRRRTRCDPVVVVRVLRPHARNSPARPRWSGSPGSVRPHPGGRSSASRGGCPRSSPRSGPRADPTRSPSLPASTPIIRTPASPRNRWNSPMELLPPPTQATRQSGSRPSASRIWRRASSPMTAWKSRTIRGYGSAPRTDPST